MALPVPVKMATTNTNTKLPPVHLDAQMIYVNEIVGENRKLHLSTVHFAQCISHSALHIALAIDLNN